MPEVKKFNPFSLTSNLGEFPIFNSFLDLDNFWLCDFLVFGFTYFDLSIPSILPALLMVIILVPITSLITSTCDDIIISNIDVSSTAILLNF